METGADDLGSISLGRLGEYSGSSVLRVFPYEIELEDLGRSIMLSRFVEKLLDLRLVSSNLDSSAL